MSKMSTSLLLLFFLLSASVCQAVQLYAARCLARSTRCPAGLARKSGVCQSRTDAFQQSSECKTEACIYCRTNDQARLQKFPCKKRKIREICAQNDDSSPITTSSCTFTQSSSNDAIVIPMTDDMASKGWASTRRNGLAGLVYKPFGAKNNNKKVHNGKMCFKVNAKMSGDFYFTALSYAKNSRRFNTLWVQSSLGFQMWKPGTNGMWVKTSDGFEVWKDGTDASLGGVVPPNGWRKAYQNRGPNGIAANLKTVDFDGHRLIIPDVKANAQFQVCMSGRSPTFEVFRLILIHCQGNECTEGTWNQHELWQKHVSQCV